LLAHRSPWSGLEPDGAPATVGRTAMRSARWQARCWCRTCRSPRAGERWPWWPGLVRSAGSPGAIRSATQARNAPVELGRAPAPDRTCRDLDWQETRPGGQCRSRVRPEPL